MKKSTAQMLFVSTLSLAALTACGGGGGGDSTTAPAPLPTVSVSISTSGLPVMYTGRSVSLSATGTSSANLALTYSWDFGDGTAAGTGATSAHTFAKAGTYTVKVTATDTNGTKASASGTVTIVDAVLTTPTITPSVASSIAGNAVTFTGASSDPSGGTLTYSWDFGDNTAKGSGASVQHTFAAAGNYPVVLTVTNDLGTKATTTLNYSVSAAAGAPSTPVISANNTTVLPNAAVTFNASAQDTLPLTYSWDFGDNTTGTGATVQKSYTTAGTYNVVVTATNSQNKSTKSSATQITVMQPVSNVLAPSCSGASCSASSATTYAGSGVGAWQYTNIGSVPASLNFAISGVKAGQVATLVFTNTSDSSSLTAPAFGAAPAAIPAASTGALSLNMQALNRHAQMDAAHESMHQRNHELIKQMRAKPAAVRAAGVKAANVPPVRAVAVGDTKVWVDTYDSANPVSYTLKVAQICKLKTGRNAVIWGDPNGGATAADLLALANTFCSNGGAGTGGFDALTDIMGDAYGTKSYSNTIGDTNGLLDINVVVPNVPSSTKWGGYFWGGNNFLKTAFPSTKNSNEALVFFVNGQQVTQALNYYKSTLMHEAVHMINFYQRAFVLDTAHDTWLEETTAMMGEDILAKTIFGGSYNEMTQVRIPQYLRTGGGVSYVNWTNLSSDSYAFGGAFGAYINRKYGLSMFKKIVTDCKDGQTVNGVKVTSYACMDTLIKGAGGVGMGDELAKFGISLWGNTPASALPSGLGFPQRTVDGVFDAIDVATVAKALKFTAKTPAAMVPASHYFAQETIAAGATSFSKSGVIVPAGATLHIMVRDAAP